ncbi:YidH family protein [Motilibacter aurantiacus]|uniref:YidH family protein n=1 Tax=Motilibacter aurantiacus TaxID=2714955 RepID=UPI00140C5CC7|nr:DUF202 domain-containing protein [Motilibacter aurantiacus]NHC45080.1 DUF202 domain-containing protein [Motilibacter aurantiacus]
MDEQEPDYRFTLANERTLLAWMRTALALLAAGVGAVEFLPQPDAAWVRTAAGVALGLLSVVASVGGVLRWHAVQRAMRRGLPLPVFRLAWVFAAALAAVGLAVSAMLLLTDA